MPKARNIPSLKDGELNAVLCESCPLRANKYFRPFSEGELKFVREFKTGEMIVAAGSPLLLEGHDSAHFFTILEGWALRSKTFEDGRRQVLNFGFPGDFLGLKSQLFGSMDHSVEALSDLQLCVFSRERLWDIYKHHASLGYDITWLAAREESILAQHLANVGQRPAIERLGYVILYLFERSRMCGMTQGRVLDTPITQEHLADAMGLSMVHTNKTLRRLSKMGILSWQRQKIKLLDEQKLREIASLPDWSLSQSRPFI